MEVKEAEESTISHKQVNIQFWIWMNRNQEVLNMKNEKGLKKKKSLKEGKQRKWFSAWRYLLDHSADRIPRKRWCSRWIENTEIEIQGVTSDGKTPERRELPRGRTANNRTVLYSWVTWWTLSYRWVGIQRRQWQPTPALLPGKSHGQRNLVG